jgi:hypothetical protein
VSVRVPPLRYGVHLSVLLSPTVRISIGGNYAERKYAWPWLELETSWLGYPVRLLPLVNLTIKLRWYGTGEGSSYAIVQYSSSCVWVAAARSGHVRYWTNNKVCRNYYVQRKKIHDWEELNTRPRLWYHARVSSSTGPTIRPMWYIRGKGVFYQILTIEVESRAIRGGWTTLVVHIMLWFRLERGGNGTKRYRKMK